MVCYDRAMGVYDTRLWERAVWSVEWRMLKLNVEYLCFISRTSTIRAQKSKMGDVFAMAP